MRKIPLDSLTDDQKNQLLVVANRADEAKRQAHERLAKALTGKNDLVGRLRRACPALADELGSVLIGYSATLVGISEASDAEEFAILGIAPSTSTVN